MAVFPDALPLKKIQIILVDDLIALRGAWRCASMASMSTF
jgi:hypothetical protein